MMDRFGACLAFTLGEEGGYVDNVQDPGGATNMGITLATLRDWTGQPDLAASAIEALTQEAAAGIYGADYWNRLRCDAMLAGIDLMVFDFGVNAGCSGSARLLQRAVGLSGGAVDGCIGPVTLGCVAAVDPASVLAILMSAQQSYYRRCPDFASFGGAWLARTERRYSAAQAMTASCAPAS